MLAFLATASGYGAEHVYTRRQTITLAPDAAPKLVLMAVLVLLLVLWVRTYLRSIDSR